MIPLIRLKKDVLFNSELTKVVDVLKGIAAARFHILEKQLALFERYSTAAKDFLALVGNLNAVRHPFVHPDTEKTAALLVTTDAGFLGGLNNQVVALGAHEAGDDGPLSVIGERGADAVRDLHRNFERFRGIDDSARLPLAMQVRDHIVGQVRSGECGRLVVVYPKPISFAVQEVTVETLLPCRAWAPKDRPAIPAESVIWESSMADVLEYVVNAWIGHRLIEIFALSRLAELAARAVHLEGSYQELLRQGKSLKLQYFRARHEVIDRSMREIFAAQLLYGKSRAH
ncbi:MAG: F0F1 ATP synthase subunit gamma [Candidatus Omnitrophica bacterium]|nr:F0F1 ATP synthase subunit gamma [Candidatus Omnitrophota bacterium]